MTEKAIKGCLLCFPFSLSLSSMFVLPPPPPADTYPLKVPPLGYSLGLLAVSIPAGRVSPDGSAGSGLWGRGVAGAGPGLWWND